MKLLIFSPLLAGNAVGLSTIAIAAALRRAGHEATLVRTESLAPIAHPAAADGSTAVLGWDDAAAVEAATASSDAVVYRVGDDLRQYEGCLAWLPRAPGVVWFDDADLDGLFSAWRAIHRPEASRLAEAWPVAPEPMTDWISSMAEGAIAGSRAQLSRILAGCPGPVVVLDASDPAVRDDNDRAAVLVDLALRLASTRPAIRAMQGLAERVVSWGGSERSALAPDLVDRLRIFEAPGTPRGT